MTQILSWVGTIYVVRRLGSHAVGQYAVALVVFNYLAMTFDGTLLETLVQRPPTTETRRAVFSLVIGIGALLSGLTLAVSGFIGHLVRDPAVSSLVMGVAVAFFLMSLGVLAQATLARQMAFPRLASISAAQSLCVTGVTVSFSAWGTGAWALVWGLIVGALVRVTLLNLTSWSLMWPTLRLRAAWVHLRFGGVLFADNLLWRWYTSLDTFLLGRWAGTAALGYYNLAQQVAELPLEKITTVVNDVSLPAYAELHHEEGAAEHLLLETIRTHAIVGFALFWGLATVAAYAVPVLFGAGWRWAIFPLVALAVVAPVRLIGSIETPAMTGIGRPGVLVRTKLIIAPCMTVALFMACRLWGIRGAAIVWLFVFPLCYGYAFRYVLAAAGIPYRRVWDVVRGPLTAAALMVVAVLALERGLTWVTRSSLIVLIAAILLGAGLYVLGLRGVDPEAYRLARQRLGRFLGLRQLV
jgi:O-antigen/teichoic acid export membrane protein